MRLTRITKLSLVVLAAGLCAGAGTWVGTSLAGADTSTTIQQDEMPPVTATRALTAGPATLPLRWWVSYARQTDPVTGAEGTFCGTVVIVVNTTSASITAEVEWFTGNASAGYTGISVPAQRMRGVWSDSDPRLIPYNHQGATSGTGDFYGHATVHASDPRVIVSAYLVCRGAVAGNTQIESTTTIPTHPVGSTMEYFQAGMPAAWTPPLAEVPE